MKQSMIAFEEFYNSYLNNKDLFKSRVIEHDLYLNQQLNIQYAMFRAAFNSQQAIIDRLMLEYCPKEMTQLQMSEWENSQVSLIEDINHE